MSQNVWSSINPYTTSGTMLASILTDFKDALMTGLAGLSRPAQLTAGGMWIDTTLQGAPTYQWIFKLWTGTVDVEVFRINVSSNFGGALISESIFEVQQISADTVGAIQKLIKQRLIDNGQVDSGDTIGEIRFIGRTNGATDPTVGYIKWVATDDQESAAFGGTLSFFSTPDASSTIIEHFKFINGLVESLVPLKVPALRLTPQDVATATTIVQLSASKALVEFTGSTATDVQGVNAGQDSQEITLHNRSTAVVTLKHQDLTAAANDRMKLPGGGDFVLSPEATATIYYCVADSKWKLRSSVSSIMSRTQKTISGLINTWTAPTGVDRVVIYGKVALRGMGQAAGGLYIDFYGNAYAWGQNNSGSLGDGTLVDKSSPVAVAGGILFKELGTRYNSQNSTVGGYGIGLDGTGYAWGPAFQGRNGDGTINDRSSPVQIIGGVKFVKIITGAQSTYYTFGIDRDGKGWGWGENSQGILGNGTSTARYSSPIAIVGGLKFENIIPSGTATVALASDGKAYAWGASIFGDTGTGSFTGSYSSPTLVLGGLTFKKLTMREGDTSLTASLGLTPDGDLYAWGVNGYGQLGVGDRTGRSSPVAVLGGFKFVDISQQRLAGFGITEDGTVYAWGRNNQGQLGVGDVTDRSSPVAVLGGLKFKKLYQVGDGSTLGMTFDGTLYGWGSNPSGQLGVGDTNHRSSPVAVLGGLKFIHLHTGISFVHGIATDGVMYAWGRNDIPLLGTGDLVGRSSPVAIAGPHGFMVNRNKDIVTSVPVVAGQTYDIRISAVGPCYFGTTPIGNELEEIVIEYEKRGT